MYIRSYKRISLFILAGFILSLSALLIRPTNANASNTITVAEAIANNSGSATVEGYIVGHIVSSTNIDQVAPFGNDYNIAIADAQDEVNPANMLFVKVASSYRSALGLKTNPANIGLKVSLSGGLGAYYTKPGMTSITAYTFVEDVPGVTDADIVAADLAAIEVGYTNLDNALSVTQNITLALAGTNGSTISWQSSHLEYIGVDGSVTRPSYTSDDMTVTMTATVTSGAVSDTKTFTLTVLKAAAPVGSVFFSEYIESGSNKALEIFNGTSSTIDLSLYTIKLYANGSNSASSTYTLSGYLASNDVYVIGSNTTMSSQIDIANAVANFNGNDALELIYNGIVIDVIGTVGSSAYYAEDVTLLRSGSILTGNPVYTASEWIVNPVVFTYLGTHTTGTATGPTDEEIVADDKLLLEIEYVSGDTDTAVTGHVNLPLLGTNGSTISWQTSHPSVITTSGTVTRPSYTEGNATVTLTATLTSGSVSDTLVFVVTVLAELAPEGSVFFSEYIESGSNKALEVFNGTNSTIDLSLYSIKLYANGSSTASSTYTLTGQLLSNDVYVIGSNTTMSSQVDIANAVANFNGNDALELIYGGMVIDVIGTVGSSAYYAEDVTMVRNSTIRIGTPTYTTSEWTLYPIVFDYLGNHTMGTTVPLTDDQIVSNDKSTLEIGYITGDTSTSVTGSLSLSVTGTYGSTISWQSSNLSVISNSGIVIRPSYNVGDVTVTLTATITSGSMSDTRIFVVTVKAEGIVILSVAQAIETYQNMTDVTVVGYIVGSTTDGVTADLTGNYSNTTILIVTLIGETDINKMLIIELPVGIYRDQLNLVNHPLNLGKKVTITGDLARYLLKPGLKNINGYVFVN